MPVYNAAATLPAALESLDAQTDGDWELLAVDDGSTDDSLAVLKAFSATPRLRVIQSAHHGLVRALNLGLQAARGEYLARFDADDLMHPERLERQRAAAFDGVLGCGVRTFGDESREGFERYEQWLNSLLTHEQITRDLFVESPFAHPSVLLPTRLLRAAGGYRDVGWPEDYDLWLRLWRNGARFAKLPEVLHYWRDHPGRLSRGGGAYSSRAFRYCKVAFLRESFLAGDAAVSVWGAGLKGARVWSRVLEAYGIRVLRHIDEDPALVGQSVRGRPIVAPEALLTARRDPVLVAVGVLGARERIRGRLDGMGWREGRDYVCVA